MRLDERFYPVDEFGYLVNDYGRRIGRNVTPGWKPGAKGYYYNLRKTKDDSADNRRVWVYNFDDYNDRATFEKAVEAKGKAAQLAYKYNIMPNYEDKEGRVRHWLALDSFYSEDNFFFVKGLPGYEDKTVSFQLRISNHFINPKQWFVSHMFRLYQPKNALGRKKQLSQFGLGLMLDRFDSADEQEDDETLNPEQTQMFNEYGMTFYEADLDLDAKTPQQLQKIDAFLSSIGSGKRTVVTFQELEFMFGKFQTPRTFGGSKYDAINFTERDNIKGRRGKPYPFKGEKETVAIEKPTISFDTLETIVNDPKTVKKVIDGEEYYLFDYKNTHMAYNDKDMKVYRQVYRRGNPLDKIVKDDEFEITENRIRLNLNDIQYMVEQCILKLKKRLI